MYLRQKYMFYFQVSDVVSGNELLQRRIQKFWDHSTFAPWFYIRGFCKLFIARALRCMQLVVESSSFYNEKQVNNIHLGD